MKMTSTIFLVAITLLHLVAAPLRAQDDAKAPPVKSEDKATPAPPDGNSSVRIDNTGIHVGGEEPVDISIPNFGGNGVLGPLLPIISVLAVFGMPVAIVGLFVLLRHRRNRMLHETLRAMVEKGVPIPPELLSGKGAALADASNGARHGYKDLRNGLVLIALGAAVFIMAGKIGLIPGFIGVAMIIAWLIGGKTKNHPTPP